MVRLWERERKKKGNVDSSTHAIHSVRFLLPTDVLRRTLSTNRNFMNDKFIFGKKKDFLFIARTQICNWKAFATGNRLGCLSFFMKQKITTQTYNSYMIGYYKGWAHKHEAERLVNVMMWCHHVIIIYLYIYCVLFSSTSLPTGSIPVHSWLLSLSCYKLRASIKAHVQSFLFTAWKFTNWIVPVYILLFLYIHILSSTVQLLTLSA